ncbi:MAG: transglutaminase domain-containing protein [Armatimonadota bacterium]
MMAGSGDGALSRAYDWLDRHKFTPQPHTPPAETPAERRRWLLLMLTGWLTMAGALLAASTLLNNPLLLAELAAIIALAFPVAWRLHFSEMPRFLPNYITFFAALILGVVHWRLGWFSGGDVDSRLLLSYRTLVGLFYWVMAFRAFAIRDVRDLTQTALPAISGLLLVLIASPTTPAIAGSVLVFAGTLAMLAGEHASRRTEEIDEFVTAERVRGGRWRPRVNSWISLLLAAAVAATILAAVAARVEPSNPAGQWLRRQLAWRIARLMIGESSMPYAPGRSLELGGSAPDPQDRLMLTLRAETGMKVRTAAYDIYRGRSWEQSERRWTRLNSTDGDWELPDPEAFGLVSAVTDPLPVEITPGYSFIGALPIPWCPTSLTLDVPSIRYDQSGQIMFNGHVVPGESYTAMIAMPAAISAPPGTPPPPQVDLENALQLPEDLPPRIVQLTEEIVADTTGRPAEIAIAVEGHLRTEYTYDLETPPLPPGEDFVDHFLFESQRGWCNHYASAMVIMMRIAGIPARLAAGFTSGQYVPERNAYEILDQDAHAWTEVYLPDTGWIDFDPTPADEEEDETVSEGMLESLGQVGLFLEDAGRWLRAHMWLTAALVLAVAAAIAAAVFGGRWYHRRLRPLRPGAGADARVVHAYRQALRWLADRGIERPASSAPWEYFGLVTRESPSLAPELQTLTAAYTEARFSAHTPGEDVVGEVEAALERLRDAIFSSHSGGQAAQDE